MNMMNMRMLAKRLLYAVIATAVVQPAFAAEDKKKAAEKSLKNAKPSGTLEVASEKTRLVAGGTSGKGVLHFNGQDYPFTYRSASGGLGGKAVEEMRATGNVYSLTKIEDFEGRYNAATSTAIAGTTKTSATYKNDKGVTIALQGTVKGVGLGIGAGTAVIEFVKK